MASLVKNGSNYGLVWTDHDRRPKQVRESLKTAERGRAITKKKELEWKYHSGDHDPWKRKWYEKSIEINLHEIADLVEAFISYKSSIGGQEGWSEDVAQRETYVLRKFVRIVGDLPVQNLSKKHLQKFYYRDGVTSDHTRQGDYISVNTFLNWCIKNEYMQTKPEYRPSKPQTKLPKFITPKEFKTIIDYRVDKIKGDIQYQNIMHEARGAYWIPLGWMILAGTGMRPKELSLLKLNAVFDDHILIGEDFTTKVRAERRVPLLYESRQAVQLLSDERFRRMEPNLSESDYLLGRKPDYARQELSYEFTETWKACFPNKKRTLYCLKDFFAVRFLSDESLQSSSGIRLNELREILGHASLETTQRYLKAVPYSTSIEGTIFDK